MNSQSESELSTVTLENVHCSVTSSCCQLSLVEKSKASFLSICFDDFTMFSQYFVSRTGHGFLSICRICIPSELVRFRGDLGGLFCCRSRIASFQFRSCSGIQHVLMGATKPRNGAADCRRNTTETLLRSNLYRLQQRVFPLCSALRLSSQTFIFWFASHLKVGTGKF